MQQILETHWLAWNIAVGLFFVGGAVLALLISRENRFGRADTALCLIGLKKYRRNAAKSSCLEPTIGGRRLPMPYADDHGFRALSRQHTHTPTARRAPPF